MKRTFLVALRMLLLAIAILFCAILAEGTIDISKWCEDTRGISSFFNRIYINNSFHIRFRLEK